MIKRKVCFWLYLTELIKKIEERRQIRKKEREKSCYRYYGRAGRIVVIEQKPMMRTTLWGTCDGTVIHKLAFPYVIFVISLNKTGGKYRFYGMYVHYRKEPLSYKSEMLYRPNLSNIHPDYKVCMGREYVEGSRSPFQAAKVAIEVFWKSEFNSDLPDFFRQAKSLSPNFVDLTEWEKASKKNLSFPLGVGWREACGLDEAVKRAKDDYDNKTS